MGEATYNNGGYIPGSAVPPVPLHPDDCLISSEEVRSLRLRCSRPGHPTETSDCTTRSHV
jgi:hypothetical protein